MFNGKGKINGVIMGEQVRTINKTRIKSSTGETLLASAMEQVDNAIKVAMGLSVKKVPYNKALFHIVSLSYFIFFLNLIFTFFFI